MRFGVLGPVMATNEHGPVSLGPARQRTVLAVLLVEPGATVSFDQLVDRVWHGAPPQRVRPTLHSYLSRLRTVLADAGGPVIASRSPGYLLDVDDGAVDVHQFRALVAAARQATDDDRAATVWDSALALWRGTPFADLESGWLRGVAQRFEGERFAAMLDRNDLLLRRGEQARLLPELSLVAAAYPLDERLAGQLMLALYRSGRQADALAHYRLLRERLIDELGSEPGPAVRELHQRILRQAPGLASTAPVGTAVPVDAAPAQLPADLPSFAGRAGSLRRLDALLGEAGEPPATVVITAIGGCAGIGKTTLAVHWAHRVRDRFPDGQLYLNLRGFDPAGRALDPVEALRALLEMLRVPPEQIPSSVEAQAGLYRSRLARARMLVVLDNARDAEQVRPLLPGSPGSMVLATSRDQLAGLLATEGARPLRLDLLDPDEARSLLLRRLGPGPLTAEPAAVEEIIAGCAGLPLALAVVAARAATRPELPLATLAGELADVRSRLDALAGPDATTDVRAVFSWSYEALSPAAARLFRLLGLHPGPHACLGAAASLAGLPVPRARRLLAELTHAHLLNEPVPERYTMHDLLRAYATELSRTEPAAQQAEAIQRVLDYYLHTAHAADRWLHTSRDPIALPPPADGVVPKPLTGTDQARDWLTAELPVLLAAVEQLADSGFDRHVQQLSWTLTIFLLRRGLWDRHFAVQNAAMRAARRRGDRSGEATIHRGLAHAFLQTGRHDDAVAHIQQALAIYEADGDHNGQARTLLGLTWLAEREQRYDDGLRYARRCLEAASAAGHRVLQALARNAVGWSLALLDRPEEAIAYCEQALAELQATGELAGMGDTWGSLGYAHRELGNYPQAITYYRQAIDACRTVGDRRHEATSLTQLGETYQATGDHEAAAQAWKRALEIFEEMDHPDAEALRKRLM